MPTDEQIAELPVLQHTIKVSERDGKIALDISDETGGLGLLLYLSGLTATRLGANLADRGRIMVSTPADDPKRATVDVFSSDEGSRIVPWVIWQGPLPRNVAEFRCSEPGCGADFTKPGGLTNINMSVEGEPNFRCAEHRDPVDKASHRLDLQEAVDRAVKGAVERERKLIIKLLELSSPDTVMKILSDKLSKPKVPEAAQPPHQD